MNYDRLDVPLIDWSQAPEDEGKNFKGPQNPKQCKPKTPDFIEGIPAVKAKKKREAKLAVPQIGFKTKDRVKVVSATSLLNKSKLSGVYMFDSYDSYDNTCYIVDYKTGITYNVIFADFKKVEYYE